MIQIRYKELRDTLRGILKAHDALEASGDAVDIKVDMNGEELPDVTLPMLRKMVEQILRSVTRAHRTAQAFAGAFQITWLGMMVTFLPGMEFWQVVLVAMPGGALTVAIYVNTFEALLGQLRVRKTSEGFEA